jgi:hypothetical protein
MCVTIIGSDRTIWEARQIALTGLIDELKQCSRPDAVTQAKKGFLKPMLGDIKHQAEELFNDSMRLMAINFGKNFQGELERRIQSELHKPLANRIVRKAPNAALTRRSFGDSRSRWVVVQCRAEDVFRDPVSHSGKGFQGAVECRIQSE